MLVPHGYQYSAVMAIWEYFRTKTGNPLVGMPTGTGKSIVLAEFMRSVFHHYAKSKILCVTHVKELIEQNYQELLGQWPTAPAGIYSAGLNRKDVFNSIVFCGIASVAKKAAIFGPVDILLIDEAHLVSTTENTMYLKFIADLKKINPLLKVVGLTATMYRLGSGMLTEGPIFTDVCFDATGMEAFNWFIQQGYLMPLVPKPTETQLDVSGVHMRGGEFIASELQIAVDKAEITDKALDEAMRVGHDRQSWLIFASGVDHAKHIASALTDKGILCKAVYSGMDEKGPEGRDQIIDDFKSGKLRALVNNNVLTTGFNHKALDMIIILRPTASTVLWVQMLGRGTRCVYAPGFDLNTQEGRFQAIFHGGKKNCLVLDFARNTKRLGQINDPVIPRKKGAGGGEAPVKLCEVCDTYNHASARFCGGTPAPNNMPGFCGSEFSIAVKFKEVADTTALIKPTAPIVVEVFRVDTVTYTSWASRKNGIPMLQATYYCGLRRFQDYVCLEHENNYARHKAHIWWRTRSGGMTPPETVDAGLEVINHLAVPTHIRVWVNNKPYPQIMDFCFDGTAFNTTQVTTPPPQIQVNKPVQTNFAMEAPLTPTEEARYNTPAAQFMADDDIPF